MPCRDWLSPLSIISLRLVHVVAGSCPTVWKGHGLHARSPTEGHCGFWFGAVTHKDAWDAHAMSLSEASFLWGKCPGTHVLGCDVPGRVPQRERTNRITEAGHWGAAPLGELARAGVGASASAEQVGRSQTQ